MLNVFLRIDHVWSYNFIGSMRGFYDIDMDVIAHIYNLSLDYLRLQHNFVYTHNAVEFKAGYDRLLMELQRYPISASYFEGFFKMLYNEHRLGLNSLAGTIQSTTMVNNDNGDLDGAILSIRPEPPCIQSILNPISQLGINQLY